jgi:hypothetical protein
MRAAIVLVAIAACSRSPKAAREPLVISDTCTLTTENHVLDETGADVGTYDPATREVTVGSIRLPVQFTKKPDGIDVELPGLGPFIVRVDGDNITVSVAQVTKPLVARLSGFHGTRWLELAALVTAIPILPAHEPIDAGVDSGAAGPEVPPPPPPPNPHFNP